MPELISTEGNCSRQRGEKPRGRSVPVTFAQQQKASVAVARSTEL